MPKVKICFIDSSVDHFSEEYRFMMRSDSSGWEDISQKDYIQLLERRDLLLKVLRSQGLIGQNSEVVILAQDVVTPSWSLGQVNNLVVEAAKKEARRKKMLARKRKKLQNKEKETVLSQVEKEKLG